MAEWTGGTHCCFKLYIYALGDAPKLIQKVDLGRGDIPRFDDLDHDGIPEITLNDWTFAYWKMAFVDSPAPAVILKYNGEKWVFSSELMKAKGLNTDFGATIQRVKKDFALMNLPDASVAILGDEEFMAPVSLLAEMLNLIYTGRADRAQQLLGDTWPSSNKNKEKFLKEFAEKLATSEYFGDLAAMNPSLLAWLKPPSRA